jgi:hypothetical protein
MASEKTCYWLALAILVVGLSGRFANQAGDWARGVVHLPMQWAEQTSNHITSQLETAALRLRHRSMDARVLAQVKRARAQARVACVNTSLNHHAADMAQLNAAMVRLNAKRAKL